ncbi:unnamed protein product [Ambrosiozyma monospora]|uniref:Unnamed protein product n=1 Tax=Ambrosiozyma monospora TaxID=43982 RepID=A0A9W7DC05_AMBMO|nr:unnamed protein product [Ambrosiozyma monospora]
MKFSTSVLFTVMASSAMASSDASASDIPPSSTVVSVPSSLSSAVVDLNDPVQKSIISIIGRVLTGGSLFAGSPVNNKIKRDLESIVSASYAPAATDAQSSSSATPSVQIDLNDPVQKNIISDIDNFLKNAVSGIVKRDEASPSADQLAQLVANLAAAVSSASASSASVTPSATATNAKRDVDVDSAVSYTPSATVSSYATYASASSSAVVDPNDPVQKSIWSIIGKLAPSILGLFGGHNNNKLKRDLESLISVPIGTASESPISVDLSDTVQQAPTSTNVQASSSVTPSVQIDLNDPVQKNIISDIDNFLKNAVSGIVKRDEAAPSADQLAQLVANLAAAVSSASVSSASATPSGTATNAKRDVDVDSAVSYTPSATVSSYATYTSASSSAVVDPNDPVQKSIWSIIGKLAPSILGLFGGHNNNKLKRDLESLISVPTGTSAPESSVSVDLSDPVQKAIWGNIGKTVMGSISKRDVDSLTDAQRKGLDTWLKQHFGISNPLDCETNGNAPVYCKREVTNEQLDHLVAQLAAAASSAASVSAISSTVISSLL